MVGRDSQGAICRSRERRGGAFPNEASLVEGLGLPGSCLHLKHACSDVEDFRVLDWLAKDIETAGYRQHGDALTMHRSKKHLQIWGDALTGSEVFTLLITHVLALFDLTLVDCWVNLYRTGDDSKSWHHDNYQDRYPRPTATIGISLGQGRDLAFQHAKTGEEFRVLQENGDIFAFDEPFNYIYKHGVPSMPRGIAPGRRISVIIWANEMERLAPSVRTRNPGMADIVPSEIDWAKWATGKYGALCRGDRDNDESGNENLSRVVDRLPPLSSLEGGTFGDGEGWNGENVGLLCDLKQMSPQSTLSASDRKPSDTIEKVSFYPRFRMRARGAFNTSDAALRPELSQQDRNQSDASLEGPGQDLPQVTQALTLQGAQQVMAILRGHKLIENRGWRIPRGWYALHAGSQQITEERAERLRQVWPDAPPEHTLPHSAIVGAFYVSLHKTPEECAPDCVWARGPICHMISSAIEFAEPIPSRGDKGLWQLSEIQRRQVQEQLRHGTVREFDIQAILRPSADARAH